MPLINRSINHAGEGCAPVERVKIEEPLSDLPESSLSEGGKEVIEGKWNDDQNLRFVIFVNYYQEIFSSRHKRKTSKIFKTFEEYLHDRTAAQCRSHYQKIIQKFKTVAKVKKHYEGQYGREAYRKEFQNFKEKWEQTHPPISIKDPQIRQFKEISIQTDPAQDAPREVRCRQCSSSVHPGAIFSPQPSFQNSPQFNPYLYWNQMPPMNYFCVFPPRSEETIDIS